MAILSDEFYYQPIRIDTINTRVYADIVAKEGDANGRGLLVTLTENGLMKDTTGIALNLKWEHTSVGNQGLDNFEAVDLSKGLYKITYPTEMLNRGKVRAFIQIIDSGKLAGTRNIEIAVDRGVGDDTAIASSDSFSALAQALIDVNNLESTYAPRLLSAEQQLAEVVKYQIDVEDVMLRNGLTTLQQVFDFVPENTELTFTKLYEISTELLISKNAIKLTSRKPATATTGAGIKNIGTGNLLRVTGQKFECDGIIITGNGDPFNFATGSTGLDGITFDGARNWKINKCHITGHGGHGVVTKNGVWICRLDDNVIYGNAKDGINSKSTGGGPTDQNGNNMVLNANTIALNGENGINWRASALTVIGNDIEGNNGVGILFDLGDATVYAGGVDISGANYIENNRGGQVKIITGASVGIKSLLIEGNYFNASYVGTGATSLIVFEGVAYKNIYVDIGNNYYNVAGAYITHYIDGGNTLKENCKVTQIAQATLYTNLGHSKLEIANYKSRIVSGLTQQKALPWSTPNKSDNAISVGVDTYFPLPMTEGELLYNIKLYVDTDSVESYSVQLTVYSKDMTAIGTLVAVASFSQTYASGGSRLITWAVYGSSIVRALASKGYYVRVIVSKPTTGTTLFISDVQLDVI